MTPGEYAQVRTLFDRAMELSPGERHHFVIESTPPDGRLRPRLLAMVEAGDDSRFLAGAILPRLIEAVAADGDDTPVQIANYRILRELGRGGMGVVYLALRNDDVFHKVVALKVIDGGSPSDQTMFIERFKQERQILAGLDHPNIARILDGGDTDDGRPFYVMEYVAGSPIDDYCSGVTADLPTRIHLITQVCEAVEYLHAHAIAHRDIKPDNILVTPDGRVKLVDFGVAKVDTIDGLIATASIPGQPTMIMTPGYASPERVTGDPSGRSGDIYSIGVVLYQLLTGRLPYADPDGRPNLAAQLSGCNPEPPSSVPAAGSSRSSRAIRSDLDCVVLTALQHDPLRRYLAVQTFAEDLRRCLDRRPIVARPDSPVYRLHKLVVRNRVTAALAALLALSIVTGMWMAVLLRMERARLEARETAVSRGVMLLNMEVAGRPGLEKPAPSVERIADVQAANRFSAPGSSGSLPARVPDSIRLQRLITDLRRFLDRADEVSRGTLVGEHRSR